MKKTKRSFNIKFYVLMLFISTIIIFLVPNPIIPLMAATFSLWEVVCKVWDSEPQNKKDPKGLFCFIQQEPE